MCLSSPCKCIWYLLSSSFVFAICLNNRNGHWDHHDPLRMTPFHYPEGNSSRNCAVLFQNGSKIPFGLILTVTKSCNTTKTEYFRFSYIALNFKIVLAYPINNIWTFKLKAIKILLLHLLVFPYVVIDLRE